MICHFHAKTDTGRSRQNNEDAYAFDEATRLAVLADGMGGYNAGEVASGMAATFIKSEMVRWLTDAADLAGPREVRRAMEICVDNANISILRAAQSQPQYAGMGTTLVVGVFKGDRLILGHIGDSRCYLWRQSRLLQITKDHSVLQEQLDAGLITPEQAAVSVHRNLVTRALGVEDTTRLEVQEHLTEPGDLYLMCSDGLTDMVTDQEISAVLAQPLSLEAKADQLVDLANQKGGRDNITVLVAQLQASPERRSLISRLLGKSQAV